MVKRSIYKVLKEKFLETIIIIIIVMVKFFFLRIFKIVGVKVELKGGSLKMVSDKSSFVKSFIGLEKAKFLKKVELVKKLLFKLIKILGRLVDEVKERKGGLGLRVS